MCVDLTGIVYTLLESSLRSSKIVKVEICTSVLISKMAEPIKDPNSFSNISNRAWSSLFLNIFVIYEVAIAAVTKCIDMAKSALLPEVETRLKRRRLCSESDDKGVRHRKEEEPVNIQMVFPDTLYDILKFGKQLSNNGAAVGSRPSIKTKYQWLSYEDLMSRSRNFGAGLVALGASPNSEYLVGIFAKSCVEWTVAEFGCYSQALITAPLYDSLGTEACHELTDFYGIEVMVCGGEGQITALMGGGQAPKCLRTVIYIEQPPVELLDQLRNFGLAVYSMQEVEELGKQSTEVLHIADSSSVATLILTSGTTGMPKAVMLSHKAIMAAARSYLTSTWPVRLSSEDSMMGVFPLAHILERLLEKLLFLHGGKVAYLTGDISTLFADAQEVHPTIFGFVPRLLTKVYEKIESDMEKCWTYSVLSKMALLSKMNDMIRGNFRNDALWDKLVFKKYQDILGGRIKTGFTGSAAVDGKILNFARAVFGCYIFEVYGQSETCGPATLTKYGDITTEHVGIPFDGVEVKLADVPDMEYYAKDECGEICTRSPFNMVGYYKMIEKTSETLDEEGWIHTGDIGMWLPDGNLRIFDRKKHIFKLSQGEYLAPERIEGLFQRSLLLTNIFIDGDSKHSYAVALVYPNYEALSGNTPAHQLSAEEVTEQIMRDLQRLGKEAKLKSYEVPSKIYIMDQPFSVENNCLTQSLKTRREMVRSIFKNQIKAMYS